MVPKMVRSFHFLESKFKDFKIENVVKKQGPMTLREGLAISAGFGWYTLAPSVISGAGHAVAGAVSFLHNVLRETLGIILLPLAASKIGCIEAVTLPGTCAMDVCLPIVERSCSAETLPYSFTTGMAACLFSALLVPLIMGV